MIRFVFIVTIILIIVLAVRIIISLTEEKEKNKAIKKVSKDTIIKEVDGVEYELAYADSWASAMSDIVGWARNLETGSSFPIFAGEKFEDTVRGKGMDPFLKACHEAFRDYQEGIERR